MLDIVNDMNITLKPANLNYGIFLLRLLDSKIFGDGTLEHMFYDNPEEPKIPS